ncbi:MAG: nascent polypeptide-associated complex protein [Nanoarchaeota archaeon]
MLPSMNPKMMEKAMKQLGIKQEQIEASEVIIKCPDKDLVIHNPQVSKIKAMGQETFQIIGEVEEVEAGVADIKQEDIKTVMQQTKVSEKKAKEALIEHKGDLAAAILALQDT